MAELEREFKKPAPRQSMSTRGRKSTVRGPSFGATPSKADLVVTPAPRDEREETIAKFKFDNQLLMKRLSEYKKAEKGAIDLVKDYANMRDKYERVLMENKSCKEQLAGMIGEKRRRS